MGSTRELEHYANVLGKALHEAVEATVARTQPDRLAILYSAGVDSAVLARVCQLAGHAPLLLCVGTSDSRDREFVDDIASRDELLSIWEEGWATLFRTLDAFTDDDLAKTVRIRGEPHTVIRAIDRELSHYGYHVGQIVLTARVLADDTWETLSIPRGKSREYNERVWRRD